MPMIFATCPCDTPAASRRSRMYFPIDSLICPKRITARSERQESKRRGHCATSAPMFAFAVRILLALSRIVPCAPGDAACPGIHARAACVIATVASESRSPEDAAALLLGIGAHETGFRTERQAKGGPAVSWFQVEVSPRERAALLADPIAAARLALLRARRCGLRAYACGRCDCGESAAKDLRRYVVNARWAMRP